MGLEQKTRCAEMQNFRKIDFTLSLLHQPIAECEWNASNCSIRPWPRRSLKEWLTSIIFKFLKTVLTSPEAPSLQCLASNSLQACVSYLSTGSRELGNTNQVRAVDLECPNSINKSDSLTPVVSHPGWPFPAKFKLCSCCRKERCKPLWQ